ncbi:MAG TPA: hypothetical protein VFS21_18990 [Roseiflexaceae bacterium]|nr:hypothetical protein [Roseiflexaceae bacterium]
MRTIWQTPQQRLRMQQQEPGLLTTHMWPHPLQPRAAQPEGELHPHLPKSQALRRLRLMVLWHILSTEDAGKSIIRQRLALLELRAGLLRVQEQPQET